MNRHIIESDKNIDWWTAHDNISSLSKTQGWKKKKKKKINELKDLSFPRASSPNGNAFIDGELQVEIFFLIIGHP